MTIELPDFPTIRRRIERELARGLANLNTNREHVIAMASDELEELYRMKAVVSFLHDGDADAFYTNMYLAAAVRARFLDCVERGMKCELSYLFCTRDRGIYEASCSGDRDLTVKLARNTRTLKADERFDDPYYYFFAQGLRLLIAGKLDVARKSLSVFDKNRNGALEGYSQIAEGILGRDEKQFNQGLELALEERREEIESDEAEEVGLAEEWLCVECLALARVGTWFELDVEVTDRLIPVELQGTHSSGYEDLAETFPDVPETFEDVEDGEDTDDG